MRIEDIPIKRGDRWRFSKRGAQVYLEILFVFRSYALIRLNAKMRIAPVFGIQTLIDIHQAEPV